MPKIAVDTRAVRATLPNGDVWVFKPTGDLRVVRENSSQIGGRWANQPEFARNPHKYPAVKGPVIASRFIIGFNVGTPGEPGFERLTLDTVMEEVFQFRRGQLESDPQADVGISFLPQEGIWQKTVHREKYTEPGVQVFIINQDPSLSQAEFFQDMDDMAEFLVVKLRQWGLLLEHQVNGLSQGLYMVESADAPPNK